MQKKKILFVGGSINQTSMLHKISTFLSDDYHCYFTGFYADGFINYLVQKGFLNFTVVGKKHIDRTIKYVEKHDLKLDYRGLNNDYDLVFISSDLIVPNNIRNKKVIHVQEGMTDPENFLYHIVKTLKLPRWMASTAMTGTSGCYDLFCVASHGYKDHFANKGADRNKLVVTGIPNFDNAKVFLKNDFPHKNYAMVATSDARETFKYENRKKTILEAKKIAGDKRLLFKLHPNEKFGRAKREIETWAPGSLVYQKGNTDHMIANCDVLICQYSSVVYIGIALGKKVYSYFDLNELKRLTPIQNNGTSAERIAKIGRELLENENIASEEIIEKFEVREEIFSDELMPGKVA
jgi:hypothetical protein